MLKGKKFSFVLLFFLIVLLLQGCSASTSDGGASTKTIKIGTTSQSFPNSYRDGDELVGFDVEIAQIVAENLGYEVEWVITDFSGLMGQLQSEQIDTVANQVAITEERAEEYQFSDPYSYAGVTVVTHKDNDFDSLSDLEEKKVGGVIGSENVQALKAHNPNIEVTTYQNRESAINDALMKRIEGYVNLEPNLIAAIHKDELAFKFVDRPFVYQEIAFPFNESNEELRVAFNEEIKKLREDGTLKELSENYYYGEDISEKEVE